MTKAYTLVADSYVDQTLVIVTIAATAAATSAVTSKVVHLLALQFVLNTFTIGSVPNKRKSRMNAFDKQSALIRLSII
jgi:hypothetical protein